MAYFEELRSNASIQEAATEKSDVRVIPLASKNLLAAEGYYLLLLHIYSPS